MSAGTLLILAICTWLVASWLLAWNRQRGPRPLLPLPPPTHVGSPPPVPGLPLAVEFNRRYEALRGSVDDPFERWAQAMGYPTEPPDWNAEPVDWRRFAGPHYPELLAASLRELAHVSSEDAVEAAVRRGEYAIGNSHCSQLYPVAVAVVPSLMSIIADPGAGPWARRAAIEVLSSAFCWDPGDDHVLVTQQAFQREVKAQSHRIRDVAKESDVDARLRRDVISLLGEVDECTPQDLTEVLGDSPLDPLETVRRLWARIWDHVPASARKNLDASGRPTSEFLKDLERRSRWRR